MHNTSLSHQLFTMAGVVCQKCRVSGLPRVPAEAEGSSSHKMIWLEWSCHSHGSLVHSLSTLSTFTFSQFTTSSFQTRYKIKMASNLCNIYYLCCPWIVEICKVAEDGAGYVITKSDDLYMGSVTATLAHQVQTFSLLFTPSSCSKSVLSCAEEPS